MNRRALDPYMLLVWGAVLFAGGCEPSSPEDQPGDRSEGESTLVLEGRPVTDHEFLNINGVAALSGGAFAVSDSDLRQVFFFEGPGAPGVPVGREGEGPNEYRGIAGLFPLANDSFAVYDSRLDRLTLWHRGMATGMIERVGGSVLAMDTLGHVLVARPLPATGSPGEFIDSVAVLKVRRGSHSDQADTVARLFVQQRSRFRGTRGGMSVTFEVSNPARPPERAALLRDGSLAIATPFPYRVAWASAPPVPIEAFPTIPYEAFPMTQDRRLALMTAYSMDPEHAHRVDWPDIVPPFRFAPGWRPSTRVNPAGILMEAPDGSLLVLRERVDAQEGTRYDVVHRDRGLSGSLELPATDFIVGFGPDVLFISRADPQGFNQLLSHPWPPTRP